MHTERHEDFFAEDSGRIEAGNTPAQWACIVHSSMNHGVAAIWDKLDEAAELMRAWLKAHGGGDPAVAALEAARLPVPARLAEWGSLWLHLAREYQGLLWMLTKFVEEPPEPAEYDANGYWVPRTSGPRLRGRPTRPRRSRAGRSG